MNKELFYINDTEINEQDLLIRDSILSCLSSVNENVRDNIPTEIIHLEMGCSYPIRFKTSEGYKTMMPGKKYDENLDEI